MKSNLACVVLVSAMVTQTAQAQGDLLDTDGMAEAIVAMTSPVWTGPRTPAPDPEQRPKGASISNRSLHAPATVHVDSSVDDRTRHRVLAALERALAGVDALHWPSPIPDGDLGGDPGFDLYVTGSLAPGAYSDGLVPWTYLDRASTFAVLHPATPAELLEACVTDVYLQALLLYMDPAEAPTWRRATAAYLTWELTGRFGCDGAIPRQQAEPFRSWVEGAAGRGAGGALWLAYLSARHDVVPGRFIRDVWGLGSQRTWEGEQLRADPDLWSAIESAIEGSGDRLLDNVEELAVLRWFVGRGEPTNAFVASVDADARVPVSRQMTRLPTRVTAPRALQPFGSAYLLIDSEVWHDSRLVRAWLRGEYGVRWSFVSVQLDALGNEVRRISAPQTGVNPSAYLPIEIDDATRQLLFVVTNLSNSLPDADEIDTHQRAFQLIVDRADD